MSAEKFIKNERDFPMDPNVPPYKEARKLLDHRFGNPVHVAEAYKSSLEKWPQISDGNSSGVQEFSDFLVQCKEAMKSMKSMGDLDSTQTLLQISAKLPSYSGVKCCRQAMKHKRKQRRLSPLAISQSSLRKKHN